MGAGPETRSRVRSATAIHAVLCGAGHNLRLIIAKLRQLAAVSPLAPARAG